MSGSRHPFFLFVSMHLVDVAVIGAGQAGLSAAYHLRRRGYTTEAEAGERTFVVLDADAAPGGAWQHRWESLTMATVNGIYELPGMPVPPADPAAASRDILPPYFAAYEKRFGLDVQRPVRVLAVRRAQDDPDDRLLVETVPTTSPRAARASRGASGRVGPVDAWAARHVINATGTWTRPFIPFVPGARSFRGRQLHVADYRSADEFAGKRVVVVGGGVSAIQLLEELSHVAETIWVTRREPVWMDDDFDVPARVAAIAGVEERVRRGLPPGSVISVTGLHWTPWAREAQERGILNRRPMFTAIEPTGVRMPDGKLIEADVILWATGFRAAIDHLAPLHLRTQSGGIRVANGRSIDEPRLFLIGYGPSQSTVGANRAGRDAVRAILAEEARVAA
jgi:cation diffusion facilitator CzcD-associated flavoprotein CzcO